MVNNSTFFIGIDLGDKLSVVVILHQEGELIEESRIPTTKNTFIRMFKRIPSSHIAMEESSHSHWPIDFDRVEPMAGNRR
jgi:activator of 2-hydroxyglutaryl-CoA dehydratase